MKKILIGIAIAALLGIAAYFLLKDKNDETGFRTEKAIKGDIVETVTATGTVNAVTTVLVGTQVSGTIKHIYADFNSPVKKDQLIAQLDPAPLEAQLEQARAGLLAAKANVEKAEAVLLDAKRKMDRSRELFARELITKKEFDTSETDYDSARAQLSVAKAQAVQAEAAVKYAETNFRYTKILSPINGIIISRNVDVGQTVAASFQTPTLFLIAHDLTKMQIDSSVVEADIGKVKVGQPVEFTVDAYPEIIFKGSVWQVRNAPITVQNVVTYDVVVKVDNPVGANGHSPLLKPGMTANVSIIVSARKDVLKIPNAALRFRLPENHKKRTDEKGKGIGVWTIRDKKPEHINVSMGISDGNYTELISDDIKEGQEVIVESLEKSKEKRSNSSPRGPRTF